MNRQIVFRPNPDYFVVGGSIRESAASYVERTADKELLENLQKGESCYILTTRQMGKSSLVVHTAAKLKALGISCAIIDLTSIGTQLEQEAWYLGQLKRICDQLCPQINYLEWWEANASLGAVQRYVTFLSEVLLKEVSSPVVLFIDEIDSLLQTSFSDDYFAALRSIYNQPASDSRLQRLTFVLVGTASLSDLIKAVERTQFNIGKRIELNDFIFEEAQSLAVALAPEPEFAFEMLKHIFEWTDGHPYLTQKTCYKVAQWAQTSWDSSNAVSATHNILQEIFLSKDRRESDGHIQLVRDRLIKSPQSAKMLREYRRILQGETLRDDARKQIHAALKLSGIVKTSPKGILQVRNKVYHQVFNISWVDSILLPTAYDTIPRRRIFITISAFILVLLLAFFSIWFKPQGPSAKALLTIFTEPEGASISLNGNSLGVTPINNYKINAGTIFLQIKKLNFFTLDTSVVIEKGQNSLFSFQLTPLAKISIKVNPADAEVFLNGKRIETTLLANLELPIGPHRLLISAQGYHSKEHEFVLIQGTNSTLTYSLDRLIASTRPRLAYREVRITSEPFGGTILLNGKMIGITPYINNVKPGIYQLIIHKEGYKDFSTMITVRSGETTSLNAQLLMKLSVGKLVLLIKPYGSIFINEELYQNDVTTQSSIDLAPGVYTLKVTNPSFGEWEKIVRIAPDSLNAISIDFEKTVRIAVTAFDATGRPILGEIFVDKQATGFTTPRLLILRIGKHRIAVRREGYELVGGEKLINLEADISEPLRFTLKEIQ